MRLTVTSLVVAAAAVCVAAQPMVPELSVVPTNAYLLAPQTNGKRFAAGLPPLPPRSRHGRVPYGGSKVDAARRAAASPSPHVNVGCNVLVKKSSDGSLLGYVKASGVSSNVYYGPLQSEQATSLEVSFSYQLNGASTASQLDLLPKQPLYAPFKDSYPYIGATIAANTAAAELKSGVSTYAYLTNTAQTPQGATPLQAGSLFNRARGSAGRSESAIWKYDPITRAITAQWINSDGSSPPTYLAYTGDALFLTGDMSLLRQTFLTGDMSLLRQTYSTAVEVIFACEPTLASSVTK